MFIINPYVSIMNDVIEYIEAHITRPLTVHTISKQFAFSEYHFSRLFHIFTGTSIKQYVLGRKLSLACELLKNTPLSVTDIAFDLGFEYPEVFSRSFKKQFGYSPLLYRKENFPVKSFPRASIHERNVTNYRGGLILKDSFLYVNQITLYGTPVDVTGSDSLFGDKLINTCRDFLKATNFCQTLIHEKFYAVVNCHKENTDKYTVFYGKESTDNIQGGILKQREIPAGWYACFSYYGDMLELRETFEDDLYRWLMAKEIMLCSNGIGMINIFQSADTKDVKILVPIIKPD